MVSLGDMALEVLNHIWYYIKLTGNNDVLWAVAPLAIATIMILSYFERYKEEMPGWGSYFSNSLVLLFVSLSLFRYIYSLNGLGAANFLEYPQKSIASVLLLGLGSALLSFNFRHILPEKVASYLSSPLSVNLVAYGVILFVYSDSISILSSVSLIVWILSLSLFINLMRIPLRKLFVYIEREKKKEELKNAKEQKFRISELKEELKKREKNVKKYKLKEAEDKKKQALKVKKVLSK